MLISEAIVIALAILPAIKLGHVSAGSAGLVGALAVAGAIALAAVAGLHLAWTLAGGSLLQLMLIASGAVIPAMYILGGIFTLLWITGIWLGHRVESSR